MHQIVKWAQNIFLLLHIKKVLTEVILLLYHSNLGTIKSLIAVQCISLLR